MLIFIALTYLRLKQFNLVDLVFTEINYLNIQILYSFYSEKETLRLDVYRNKWQYYRKKDGGQYFTCRCNIYRKDSLWGEKIAFGSKNAFRVLKIKELSD
jgi:hypothetical protein